MKQRRKILLALLLSASVAATPIASAVPAFAENPDFTASAEFTDTPEEETSAETEASASEDFDSATTDTDVFSAGEVEYTAEENVSDQARLQFQDGHHWGHHTDRPAGWKALRPAGCAENSEKCG